MPRRSATALMMCLGLALGCATAASSLASAHGVTRSCSREGLTKANSLAQAAQAIVCAVDSRLLIIGDLHGSNEIPGFVGRLLDDASSQRPVRLGLELEGFEQQPIRTYVASRGTASDREALLHDDFWAVGDGRMSQAIVRLIERARQLRAEGRDVEVFTTVPEYPGEAAVKWAGGADAYRSAGMAQAIHREIETGPPHALVIAFMGNAHSAYVGPGRGNDATVTERLQADSPYVVNPGLHGGTTWNCMAGSCGPHLLEHAEAQPDSSAVVRMAAGRAGQPTQVWVRFPPLTPSPPAKEKK